MKYYKKVTVFILFAILIDSPVFSKNYIAAVTGASSGTGTLQQPYDIATAVSKAVAGDTVYIRGGQYMMSAQLSLNKGGNATAYINIWAYPGDERPVLDFYNRGYSGTNAASERGVSVSKDYYFIKGLDITRAGDNGMHIQGSYNKVQNCRFYKNCDAGLQITGGTGSYNQIMDCDAYSNFDYKTASGAGGNADGFACKLTVGPGNKFIRCRSWDNSDDGYDCYGSTNDIYFADSWAIANGKATYDVTNYPGNTTGTITNTGNGNGFKVGGNSAAGGAILIRCISTGHKIASSSNKGFDQNNNVGRVFCFNCLSYNDGRGFSFPNNSDSRGAHLFYNNIVLSANNNNSIKSTSTQITNSWNNISASTNDFISLVVDSAKVDRHADGSLTNMGGLFRLKSTSTLINSGSEINIDTIALTYYGSAPDLGPFEYNPTTPIDPILIDKSNIITNYSSQNNEIAIEGAMSMVEVFDISGKKVYLNCSNTNILHISTMNWSKGMKLIRIQSLDGCVSRHKVLIY